MTMWLSSLGVQGITVRTDDGGLTIARILPGSVIEKQGTTRLLIYLFIAHGYGNSSCFLEVFHILY